MNTGIDIRELANQLVRRSSEKKDFVIDTREIGIEPTGEKDVSVHIPDVGYFRPTANFHSQLSIHTGIPARYYDRMLESSRELFIENVRHWLDTESSRRMVRCYGGKDPVARAFLSDRYRRIENEDIARTVLPILLNNSDAKVVSCNVSDDKMYIKAVFPKVEREIALNDPVQSGIVISNSETGRGGFKTSPFVYRLVCLNGMIAESALNVRHVGRRIEEGEDAYSIFTDEALAADDSALMLKVRDIVNSAMNTAQFDALVTRMQAATEGTKIEKPIKAVEALTKVVGLSQKQGEDILVSLLRNDDMSRWGLLNAVTEQANHDEDYESSTLLETIGGQILGWTIPQWERVALAA